MADVAGSQPNLSGVPSPSGVPNPSGVEERLDRTQRLVGAAQRGEPGAFDRLIEGHLDDLRAFVRLQVDDQVRRRESCGDFVQSICREVLEGLARFEYRGPASFRAWLFTAALNKVRQKHEFHRAQKRDVGREAHPDPESPSADLYRSLCSLEPSPSQNAIASEQAERIERAMAKLPDDHREVLLLARVVGLSHDEIAQRMGRTPSATRTLLSRASVRLLAALEARV